jgi:tetratricopeptide (TPR) repeat protein
VARPGDHRRWEESCQAASAAVARGDLGAASTSIRAALEEAVGFPPTDPRLQRTYETLESVLRALHGAGGIPAAERLIVEMDSIASAAGPRAAFFAVDAKRRLAGFAYQRGQFAKSEELASDALTQAEQQLGPEHPLTLQARTSRVVAIAARDPQRGIAVAEADLAAARESFGAESPSVGESLAALAGAQQLAGWPERGIPPAEQALAIQEKLAGPNGGSTLRMRMLLAELYASAGRIEPAVDTAERVRPMLAALPDASRGLVKLDGFLAQVWIQAGELQKAVDALARAEESAQRGLAPDAPERAPLLGLASAIEEQQDRHDEAAGLLERAIALDGGRGGRNTDGLRLALARVESRRGHLEAATQLVQPVLRGDVSDVQFRAFALNALAYIYAISGKPKDALPLGERALELLAERIGRDNPGLAGVLDTVGRAQLELGRLDDARASFDRVLAALEQRPGPVASELETWRNVELLAKRLGDSVQAARAQAEVERRQRLLARAIERKARPASGLADYENEQLNFRFRPPGPEWVPFEANRMNPIASIGYVRRDPPAFLMIASSPNTSGAAELDALASIVAAGFDKSFTLRDKKPLAIAGMDGILLVFDALMQGQSFNFAAWLTLQAGHAHQLSVWGPAALYDEAGIEALAAQSFAGFALLDPKAGPALADPAGRHRSERYGYTVDLAGSGWRAWPAGHTDFPHADWGALLGQHAALVVVPISLFGRELSLDALATGLGSTLNGFDADSARPIERAGSRGREHEFTREVDGVPYRFRARVLQREGVGVLAAAWVAASAGDSVGPALEALDHVTLGPARAPVKIEELDAAERARHAFVFNEIGIDLARQQRSLDALAWLELAVSLGPEDPTVLENAVYLLRELGRYADALARLEAAAELVERSPKLMATRAAVRAALGQTDEAIADYARAFDAGLTDPDAEVAYADLLVARGERTRALAFLDARIEAGAGPALRRQRARVKRLDGDAAGSIEDLQHLLERSPDDVAVLFDLAESQAVAGDSKGVIETCDRILTAAGPEPYAHYLKARAQVAQGNPAGAKASLEQALELEPESVEARDFLAHVSAMLGQGENSALQTEIEPVEIPAAVKRRLDAAPAPGPDPDAPAVTLSAVKGVHFEAGRELRSTLRWRVEVLDQRGVEQLSRLEFDLQPLYEDLHVNSLVVRDAAGRELARGDPSDAYVLHVPEGEIATSTRRVYVPVRGLAPGATIDLVLTWRDKGAPERFSYVEWSFASGLPVGQALLFVTGDVEKVRTHASARVESERGDDWLAFWAERVPAERWEPNQPQRRADLPIVRLGDARDEWEPLGRAYLAEIADTLAPSPAVTEAAREPASGADGPDAKARALARHVQGLVSYQAIAFGRRARMPKAAAEVLQLRYGDCKDHSVLLHQLLGAAGIRSRLALARIGGPVDPSIPSLDQFDHMIVECLDCREARFFDATDKSLSLGGDVPRGLGGATVLVLDAESPRFETIPMPALAPHYASSQRSVAVGLDGALAVDERIEFGGYPAAWVRDFLRGTERAAWKEALHRLLAQPGDVIEEMEVESLEATEKPLRLRMRYAVRDGFSKSSRGWIGRTPMLWETRLLGMDPVSDRSTPFELASPMRFSGDVRLVGPSGRPLLPPGEREVRRDGRFTTLDGRIGAERDALVLRYEITRLAGEGPPQRYESARAESVRVFDFLRQPIESD